MQLTSPTKENISQGREKINENNIKVQSFKGQTETATNFSIQAFAKANNINLMKSIIMINSDAQGVLIYSTATSL